VYDITKQKSFDNLQKWLTELREHGAENMTLMLIGNKSDLSKERMIKSEMASDYAEKH